MIRARFSWLGKTRQGIRPVETMCRVVTDFRDSLAEGTVYVYDNNSRDQTTAPAIADVFNVLLCLTTGGLPDSHGHTADFRNTPIVFDLEPRQRGLGRLPERGDIEQARPLVMKAVRAALRPEFRNF